MEAVLDEASLVDGACVAQAAPTDSLNRSHAAGVAAGGFGLVKEAVLPELASAASDNVRPVAPLENASE